ncbi:aspartate-semialdehyde dehydrogenase [bacterium]|nr:aspartate-semialdehyde dehydrogenase [FCB group bacterium]MBL7192310.1 aspartate-semialdehyde dehydrogenase [bacterium]
MRIAVIGATGLAGGELLKALAQRDFPVDELIPYATESSSGQLVKFAGRSLIVTSLGYSNLIPCDFAFFCAGDDISRKWAPEFVKNGAVVIDKSNAFRLDPNVPLVVPEVNHADALNHQGIIANPNCSTIQMVLPLYPLHNIYKLKSVIVTSFQSVSGAGKDALAEYESQLSGGLAPPAVLPRRIAGNCIPQIGGFTDFGETTEEAKFRYESRKIMHIKDLKVSAAAVRVPVKIGHSLSVHAAFEKELIYDDIVEVLSNAPGVITFAEQDKYPTPLETAGKDFVFVGRLRITPDFPRSLNMWITADNLRKGAATNAVQIAETVLNFQKAI